MKRLANGKLWDKYNNLKKYVKHNESIEKGTIESIPECQELLLKLRAMQPDDPNLQNFWKETFKARDKQTSIAKYYDEYPILKTSLGSTLVMSYTKF